MYSAKDNLAKILVRVAALLLLIDGIAVGCSAISNNAGPRGMTSAGTTAWKFTAPSGLSSQWQTTTGYELKWNGVKRPQGQAPSSYTIETLQLNDVKVDQFTTKRTTALVHDSDGKGLHPGWRYKTYVWANGGPLAPPHATITVSLPNAPAPKPQPSPTPATPQPSPAQSNATSVPTSDNGGYPDAMTFNSAIWGSVPVFEDNFPALAARGQFLKDYPDWGGYPVEDVTADHSGHYDSNQVSVVTATDGGSAVHAMDVLCTPGSYGNNVSADMFPAVDGIGTTGHAGMLVEERIRIVGGAAGWHLANMLWPVSENWPADSELDYYEADANATTVDIFSHWYGATDGSQQDYAEVALNQAQWNTVALAWLPGQSITWYVNGKEIAQFTDHIPPASDLMRLVLDVESAGSPSQSAHVQYDWVRVYFPR